MKESEYNRLRAEVVADYRRKLEALEMVWKMTGGAIRNDSEKANTILGKGALLKAVRQALADISGNFTLHDVEEGIRLNNPSLATALKRPSLSSALKRLQKDSEITLVTTGRGKRASIYRKVPDG